MWYTNTCHVDTDVLVKRTVNISRQKKNCKCSVAGWPFFYDKKQSLVFVRMNLSMCALRVRQYFPGGHVECVCVCVCASEALRAHLFLGTSQWPHHDGWETRHWGGCSAARQLRESSKAAQTPPIPGHSPVRLQAGRDSLHTPPNCCTVQTYVSLDTHEQMCIYIYNSTQSFLGNSEVMAIENALHQHIQAYGLWTHWWAHTYGAGGFCCFAWEEGTVLAFDQTPNHWARHTKYSLKNSLSRLISSHYLKKECKDRISFSALVQRHSVLIERESFSCKTILLMRLFGPHWLLKQQ